MKRMIWMLALLVPLSAACSSSTDALTDPEGTAEALQDCGILALLELIATVDRVGDMIDEATGEEDLPNVTITPTGTTNQFTVNGTFDTNADGTEETTLNGTATFSTDPSGGFELGDSVAIMLSQTGLVNGTIDVTATATLSGVSLSGTATYTVAGCTVTFTFPAGTPLNIASPLELTRQLAGLALGNFGLFQVSGTFMATLVRDGVTMSADISLPGDQTLGFSNIDINGIELDDDVVTLPVSQNILNAIFCLEGAFGTLESVSDVVEELAEALLANETDLDGDPFTATPVAGQPNTFDVTVVSSSLTFNGRIIYPSDPTAGSITGLVRVPNWTISATVPAGGVLSGLTGNSTAETGVTLEDNEDISFYGSCVVNGEGCTTTVAVSPNAPFVESFEAANRLTFSSTFSDENVAGDLVFLGGEEAPRIVNATVNGVPVPGALLDIFVDLD